MSDHPPLETAHETAKVISFATTAGERKSERSRFREGFLLALLLAVIATAYGLPFALTRRLTGPQRIPPLFAPDTYLYLSFAQVRHAAPGVLENPWYGIAVPAAGQVYENFAGGTAALRLVERLCGSMAVAVPVWTILCVLACAATAWWFFRQELPPGATVLIAACVAVTGLINTAHASVVISAWLHPHNAELFGTASLPWLRLLYPQSALPLVFVYFGSLIAALEQRGKIFWCAMGAVQAAAIWVFPYATMLMALGTALALLAAWWRDCAPPARSIVLYGLVCAIADFGILAMLGGFRGVIAAATPVAPSDPLLRLLTSKTFLTLAVLTAAALAMKSSHRGAQAAAVGIGLANCLMVLADVVAPVSLQISHHALYFVQFTIVALLAIPAGTWWERKRGSRWPLRWSAVALIFAMATGVAAGYGVHRSFAQFNADQAAMAQALAGMGAGDLVIAPATAVDEGACWVPLTTGARVAYCRNAEMLMAPAERNGLQRDRYALYLFLSGKDVSWLKDAFASAPAAQQANVLEISERLQVQEARDATPLLRDIEGALASRLEKLRTGDTAMLSWIRQYRRIVVIDYARHPVFAEERVRRLFGEATPVRNDRVTIRIYSQQP